MALRYCYLFLAGLYACSSPGPEPGQTLPQLADAALTVELVAADPDIVTPIGLSIDAQDRLYVLESHTHFPPEGYQGPRFDRIRQGQDRDGDGLPETWSVFADSIEDGMNLFVADGKVFLVEKNQVWTFEDTDGDGVSDRRNRLLVMDPPEQVYDHAGLLGLTLGPEGWLYVSRGNTGGQYWRITGTDGTYIEGYGDGGNVFRCRPDGTGVEEVATGFWNPFDLKFDREGRLLLVDNDPDSRGPNRLVEVVAGGDYGYRSLYGGSGIHPFLAWNGELPTTLPYAAALGEAPSGLLDGSHTQFPGYQAGVLVTVWEEKNVVFVPKDPATPGGWASPRVLLQGRSDFHPVALAANSRGELYLTDWVVRQYPNHGKGRIWRIRAKDRPPQWVPPPPPASRVEGSYSDVADAIVCLGDPDPFVRARARFYLKKQAPDTALFDLSGNSSPRMRTEYMALWESWGRSLPRAVVQAYLEDPDSELRYRALIHLARTQDPTWMPVLESLLARGKVAPGHMDAYLALIRHLQPDFREAYREKRPRYAKQVPRRLPPGYVWQLVADEGQPLAIRVAAAPFLAGEARQVPELLRLLRQAPEPLQAAMLPLLRKPPPQAAAVSSALVAMATDTALSSAVRTQALIELGYQSPAHCEAVAPLLHEAELPLRWMATKYLCRCDGSPTPIAWEKELAHSPASPIRALINIRQLCAGQAAPEDRPPNDAAWRAAVDGNGDPFLGKWIFQSHRSQCMNCHRVQGWGGTYGPDLSHIGSSKSPEQLIQAILSPSAEMSPEWQGWYVTDQDGITHLGRQIDVGFNHVELLTPADTFATYARPREYGISPQSLMPEGLEHNFTQEEFNHLIAYLFSLK